MPFLHVEMDFLFVHIEILFLHVETPFSIHKIGVSLYKNQHILHRVTFFFEENNLQNIIFLRYL